jgi:hypothetical protein
MSQDRDPRAARHTILYGEESTRLRRCWGAGRSACLASPLQGRVPSTQPTPHGLSNFDARVGYRFVADRYL